METESVLITVIIPNFNNEKYIIKSINSVTNQTYSNLEILICDDGSTDNSLAILQNLSKIDKRIKLLNNKVNLGIVATLNLLIKKAQGEYIVRFDADDIMHPEKIAKQLNYLIENKLDIVGTSVITIDEHGNELGKNLYSHQHKKLVFISKFSSPILHIWLCKRSVYDIIGEYRAQGVEDYDFILRAINIGLNIGNVENYFGEKIRLSQGNTQSISGYYQRKLFNYIKNVNLGIKTYNENDIYNIKNEDGILRYSYTLGLIIRNKKSLPLIFKIFLSSIVSPLHLQYHLRRTMEKLITKFY